VASITPTPAPLTLTSGRGPNPAESLPAAENRRAVRDSLLVSVGGQLEQVAGTLTAFALRWGLDPARLGLYTYLRLFLDNTNRSSLGVSLGAVQEIPILRASGRADEAQRVTDVAYTTNTITCLVYASGLLIWAVLRAPALASRPLAVEWTGSVVAVAVLALLKRYQDFLIAVLRAHQEFALTTTLAVLDALIFAFAVIAGLWLAGIWGLWVAVGLLFGFNIVYLHARNPLRFHWAWEWPTAMRLMFVGLPILANTAVFGAVLNMDTALILWLVPEGEKAAGYYTIALMGTSWSLDLAGRIAIVMYTYYQTTIGRTRDIVAVALQASRTTEAQAPLLAAGSSIAYLVGPVFLGFMIPRYAPGLPALRPLLPGVVLLGLAWPARQMLIAIDRPYRLCIATLIGLAITAGAGTLGAKQSGIVGVAWGMTVGYASVYLLTSFTAFLPGLGGRGWLAHQSRLAGTLAWFAAGALISAHVPLPIESRWVAFAVRCLILAAWIGPPLWIWAQRHRWGGLFRKRAAAVSVE
jgi:O-antigen/teichoic acid export membrane protein